METYGIFKTTRQRSSVCERYRETMEWPKSEKLGESACFYVSPDFFPLHGMVRTINADIGLGGKAMASWA